MDSQLKSLGIKNTDIDYIILNHLESDHTGFLRDFRKTCPNAQIITTVKGAALVRNFCKAFPEGEVQDALRPVKTGDTLDLGDGVILSFTETPNVHWPETMMTFEQKSGVLFSCDAFGSYGVGHAEQKHRGPLARAVKGLPGGGQTARALDHHVGALPAGPDRRGP